MRVGYNRNRIRVKFGRSFTYLMSTMIYIHLICPLQFHSFDTKSTSSLSSPTMSEYIALKLEKEAFVSGLVGGSIFEINKVAAVGLVVLDSVLF